MSTEQDQIAAPPTTAATGSRPAWVTDELIGQWCAWVRRDATRPASAQRRAVSGLTPSSRAAWPIV